jgi:hypothetical protein
LAASITQENSKILAEARGELQRAIENVEVACGIPSLLQGEFSEDIAEGIDEYLIRQPLDARRRLRPRLLPRSDGPGRRPAGVRRGQDRDLRTGARRDASRHRRALAEGLVARLLAAIRRSIRG